jgi:O-antigen/teichoic acid export membrane protein
VSDEQPRPSTVQHGASNLALDITGTFGTRLITMVFGLATGIITARVLGPENRGVFALVSMFPATLVTLTKFGQGISAVYFIRREKEDPSEVASNLVMIALMTAVGLVAVTLGLRETLLSSVLRGVPAWALVAVLPLLPTLLLESHLYGVLQATDRFRVYNIRLLSESVITLVGMSVALLWLRAGLAGALAVAVSVRLCMTLWVVATIHRGSPIRFRFDRGLFGRMWRYGLKSHAHTIAAHFHFKADVYMVAYFLAPAEVAFYSIAARLAEHLLWFPQAVGMALFPRLAGSSPQEAHRMTAAAVRQTLVAAALPGLALALLGRWLITLWYGADYAPAAAPLRWVCFGVVMMSLYVLLSRNFTSRNRQGVNIFAAYLALGGNILLNVFLIPSYGIVGAAMATACSYTAATLLLLALFVWESRLSLGEILLLQRSDFAGWKRLAASAWSSVRSVAT